MNSKKLNLNDDIPKDTVDISNLTFQEKYDRQILHRSENVKQLLHNTEPLLPNRRRYDEKGYK